MGFGKLEIILYVFVILIVALSIVNFSIIYSADQKVKQSIRLAEEQNIPAKFDLIKLSDSSCSNCFDIDSVINSLKKGNVNVTSEKILDISSNEAKELVKKYSIQKLPTLIVSGEISKVSTLSNNNWKKDSLNQSVFYLSVSPPYLDISTNKIKGLVSLSNLVDESCPKCADLSGVAGFLKQSGVVFSSEKTFNYNTSEGQDLINKFGIKKIPALVISEDVLDYPAIAEVWPQLNATKKEGFYALHTNNPPYRDLTTGKIEGLVTMLYLKDFSCASCYNVLDNKQILESNLGLVFGNDTVVDINSTDGKKLLNKYNITKVPIILVSPEASLYVDFVSVWPQVGDTANDSWFVMRKPGLLGTYKDLEKNQTVNQVRLYAGDDQYQPRSINVKKGDFIIIEIINAGKKPHSFAIDDLGIRSRVFGPRESGSIEFSANQTGNFTFYSYYADDKQSGLQGTLTIQ